MAIRPCLTTATDTRSRAFLGQGLLGVTLESSAKLISEVRYSSELSQLESEATASMCDAGWRPAQQDGPVYESSIQKEGAAMKAHSHIISVPHLRSICIFKVLHDFSNLTSTPKGNGVLSIKLGVVPIHLSQPHDFARD